jgi:hypothetical protein
MDREGALHLAIIHETKAPSDNQLYVVFRGLLTARLQLNPHVRVACLGTEGVPLGLHSAGEYARGKHHVNNLESHWGMLKRSIRGTHIHVSSQHLWKYAAEFAYRWNMRKSHAAMFNRLVASFSLPRLADD